MRIFHIITIFTILSAVLWLSSFAISYGFDPDHTPNQQLTQNQFSELVLVPQEALQDHNLKRYLIFGHGSNDIQTASNTNELFSVAIMPEGSSIALNAKGYQVIPDFPLEFHDSKTTFSEMSKIRKSTGSESAFVKYNYTGNKIKIAIVDTGVDFSNPDLQDAVARDENNKPIMLDADGQGLVLTNATFAADIDKYGILSNMTKPIVEKINKSLGTNVTSNV